MAVAVFLGGVRDARGVEMKPPNTQTYLFPFGLVLGPKNFLSMVVLAGSSRVNS